MKTLDNTIKYYELLMKYDDTSEFNNKLLYWTSIIKSFIVPLRLLTKGPLYVSENTILFPLPFIVPENFEIFSGFVI